MGDIATEWVVLIPVFTFILGLLGKVFYDMWHDNYVENKQRQKDALKKHFAGLEANAIKPISETMGRITNSEGTLWERGESSFYSLRYFWSTKDFEQGEFLNFKLHFPNQVDAVIKLMNEADKHNEDCRSFIDNLKELIEEKTHVPVMEGNQPPFLYSNVPVYVEKTLYKLAERKLLRKETDNLQYDFHKARIDKKKDFWQLWTEGTIYGCLSTEKQADLCKHSLTELTDSASLIGKMCDIYSEAKRLESEARSLANRLDFICDQHDKYGELLKRKKDCQVCKIIFE